MDKELKKILTGTLFYQTTITTNRKNGNCFVGNAKVNMFFIKKNGKKVGVEKINLVGKYTPLTIIIQINGFRMIDKKRKENL